MRRLGHDETLAYVKFLELAGVRFLPRPRPGRPAREAQPVATEAVAARREPEVPLYTPVAAIDLPRPHEGLDSIRDNLGDCRRCKLCEARRNIVFGVGNPAAQLVFVGEGPGADEDAQGIPFVGAAGKLLTKIIEAMGLSRDDVYICNIVKCRPPGNRVPEEEEIRACTPFVVRQIESVRPRVVCALGATAAQTLTDRREPMGRMRGRIEDLTVGTYRTKFMATYHPAYLLRSPDKKRDVWDDVQKIMAYLQA